MLGGGEGRLVVGWNRNEGDVVHEMVLVRLRERKESRKVSGRAEREDDFFAAATISFT